MWCLVPAKVEEFKKSLREGEITAVQLVNMTSAQRHELFAKKFGEENAKNINSLLEKNLLQKNQVTGYKNWIKKVSGISKETKRDLVSRVERMNRLLDPQENEQFMQELVSTRLKINITQEEAQKISELSKKITELKSKTDVTKPDILLGRAKLDLADYINKLGGKKADLLTNIAGIPRAVKTTLDLSAPLNQGWGMLSRKQFYTSFAKMFKYVVSKNAYRDLQAELITNPNYDLAKKAGLRLTELGNELHAREEQFMTTLLDKFPGVSASQRAYTGFLNKLRMDVFNDILKKAEVSGEDVGIGSKATKDIANVVNNFTGGARVGQTEGAVPFLNNFLFSPRKITSTLQMANPLNYVSPNISKTARKEATRNLIGSLSLTAGVIAFYSILTGKKQESDPTSADFGKIRSGNTRLDVSGGNATYINMLARIITGRIKGSSGVSKELGTGYGQTSAWKLLTQFLRYKLNPNASLIIDIAEQSNAIGEKKTTSETIADTFKPMFASSVVELLKSDTENKFAFALASLFGAGLNTYSQITDWSESTSKELLQFKSKVGEKTFGEANDSFNKRYDEWITKTSATEEFKNLSEEGKEKLIKSAKDKFKQEVFNKYEFKYEKEETPENEKDIIESLKPQLQSAVQKINEMLVGDVLASDNGDRITRVDLEGDTLVSTIVTPEGKIRYKQQNVNSQLTIKEAIGKYIADLGKKKNLPEMQISEKIGWNPEEHKKRLIEKEKALIVKEPPKKKVEVKPTEAPKSEAKPSKEYFASSTDNKDQDTQVKVPDNIAGEIEKTFGDKAQKAIDILHHKKGLMVNGKIGMGENTAFKIDNIDIPNYDENNPTVIKQIYNPFTDKEENSIDRGLFRINNKTFYLYLNGKDIRPLMKEAGIIDTTDLNLIDWKDTWDKMNQLEYNVKMAKLIYDRQGHKAWFASLAD